MVPQPQPKPRPRPVPSPALERPHRVQGQSFEDEADLDADADAATASTGARSGNGSDKQADADADGDTSADANASQPASQPTSTRHRIRLARAIPRAPRPAGALVARRGGNSGHRETCTDRGKGKCEKVAPVTDHKAPFARRVTSPIKKSLNATAALLLSVVQTDYWRTTGTRPVGAKAGGGRACDPRARVFSQRSSVSLGCLRRYRLAVGGGRGAERAS